MTSKLTQHYEVLMVKANEYHRKALWQEKLRIIQEGLALCDDPDFPEGQRRKQELYYEVAGIWRRLGQYDRAEKMLQRSLDAFFGASLLFRASVLGELGVIARHNREYCKAYEAFREQGRLAREAPQSIESDIEICRAVGNEGTSAFNMWQQSDPKEPELLAAAVEKLQERISRARELQERLSSEGPDSKFVAVAHAREIIGMDRLALCHIAAGEPCEAIRIAEESQQRQTREDPTVTAFSRFFYGNVLWHNGQQAKALEQWNGPPGTCTPPIAFCKEPGAEYNEYLKLMAGAGVNFDAYDEQGFSALEHAVLSDSPNAADTVFIVESALREVFFTEFSRDNPGMLHQDICKMVDEEITIRKRQAELRRQYRTILQEHIRPELRKKSSHTFTELRKIYARFLSEETKGRRMFSTFHYVRYHDFLKHGRLPISTAGFTKQFTHRPGEVSSTDPEDFIIFLSYRWIGGDVPDDDKGTQWLRMTTAVESFLKDNPEVQSERLCLWLDYACIDQANRQEKERGIDALPLAVTQCNAMVSLIDDTYYERAWCGVEVMLMRSLVESYGLHQWWEHTNGSLRKGLNFGLGSMKLTNEKDRPKIDFLARQSKLLGRDNAEAML